MQPLQNLSLRIFLWLAEMLRTMFEAMLRMLWQCDPATARHSAAVARYARELSCAVDCDLSESELVHDAALMHDIGKSRFPKHILRATRALSALDWETVRDHPERGATLISQFSGRGDVAEIVRCHHERIDGRGYPRGLKGNEIPLASRMISICDTYDVMTARDSYRTPVAPVSAMVELKRVAGTQLDGDLVESFVSMLESRLLLFEHADDNDFYTELTFQRRARHLAVV